MTRPSLQIAILGGAWINATGRARMSEGRPPELPTGVPARPPDALPSSIARPARYGRFDAYTRLGFSALAWALDDAGLARARPDDGVFGVVTSSRTECEAVDAAYYATALDDGGAAASPQLFSYTLPGILLGEAAVHFGLRGPTFCVGEPGPHAPGAAAWRAATDLLAVGAADTMAAGWVDAPPPDDRDTPAGAVFAILTRRRVAGVRTRNADAVASLLELF